MFELMTPQWTPNGVLIKNIIKWFLYSIHPIFVYKCVSSKLGGKIGCMQYILNKETQPVKQMNRLSLRINKQMKLEKIAA